LLLFLFNMDEHMTLSAEPNAKLSPKPLGQLGRDEMNLAEFPIALLTDRIPKDQTEAVYQDEIFDERTGRTLARKLTIQAGTRGLTTAIDDEVILGLIQITRERNGFSHKRVEFTRFELITKLGWPNAGSSYDRIELALDRWTSVYLKYENAWRDNRTKAWTSPQGFHIIDNFKLNDSRTSGDQLELMNSYIVWNDVIFDSFQAGYLKPLDYDLCMGLRNSTAKRMYRFLDKRFHHKPDWLFDLKELAHEHIGMGRHYEGPAHLKRNLEPAITELEAVGFLEPLSPKDRFPKDGKAWKIRLIQKSPSQIPLPSPTNDAEPSEPTLVAELVKRGVTKSTAAELVEKHPAEIIQAHIEVFDFLTEKQDKRVAKSPAGYLVKSIEDDYAAPKGFVSRDERQRQEEARKDKERTETEARRQKQEAAARDKAEREAINAYWASLTPEQQAELDEASKANTDADTFALESGPLKRMGQKLRREEYIRQLLNNPQPVPADA
jgi:Replication initiator protein A